MDDYEQASRNRENQKRRGNVYIDGTVKDCPWPGCQQTAVAGWSCCGDHFSVMHDSDRKPEPPSRRQLIREAEGLLVKARDLLNRADANSLYEDIVVTVIEAIDNCDFVLNSTEFKYQLSKKAETP